MNQLRLISLLLWNKKKSENPRILARVMLHSYSNAMRDIDELIEKKWRREIDFQISAIVLKDLTGT